MGQVPGTSEVPGTYLGQNGQLGDLTHVLMVTFARLQEAV